MCRENIFLERDNDLLFLRLYYLHFFTTYLYIYTLKTKIEILTIFIYIYTIFFIEQKLQAEKKVLLARALMNTGKSQNIIGKFIDVIFKEKNLGISLAPPRTVDGKGAMVTSIAEKGAAYKAGIIVNDFVQKIGKHIVNKREMDDIQKIIRTEKRPTTIRFIRPGNEFDVEFAKDVRIYIYIYIFHLCLI